MACKSNNGKERSLSLWHSSLSMTHHYSMAQIVELHRALEKIKDDSGHWNKSLATLRLEQEATSAARVPQESPSKEKRPRGVNL